MLSVALAKTNRLWCKSCFKKFHEVKKWYLIRQKQMGQEIEKWQVVTVWSGAKIFNLLFQKNNLKKRRFMEISSTLKLCFAESQKGDKT